MNCSPFLWVDKTSRFKTSSPSVQLSESLAGSDLPAHLVNQWFLRHVELILWQQDAFH